MNGSRNYPGFGLGYVGPDGECRREHGGPIVPGPYAYAYGLCGVIDNHGGTGAEIARERAAGQVLEVEPGDVLVLPDGTAWTVDFLRQGSWVDLHNIRLTQLEEVAA